jgi:lactoylglutathione lyase
MNTKILGLRTAAYLVSDLKAAKDWYMRAFNTPPYFDEPFYVGFNIGGYELGLMPNDTSSTDKKGGVYTYWGVEDIKAAYSNLLDLGAMGHENPQNVGGELMVASGKDPWGNILGIIYNPHFKLED